MENNPEKNRENKGPSYENIIEIWKKIVDVQQHFNDIALRIRNIALTVFTFIVGAIGYTIKENLNLTLHGMTFSYSTLLAILGLIVIVAFFYMDRFWYHKLLLGSINQGIKLEKKWGNTIPEITLAKEIGKASPHPWFNKKEIHSKGKFFIFYGLLAIPLLLIFILSISLTPQKVSQTKDTPSGSFKKTEIIRKDGDKLIKVKIITNHSVKENSSKKS